MTKYDARVPTDLKRTQQWFASIITRPIDDQSRMNPISPSGNPMASEASFYIVPSPTLQPAQRIQIYNQQYWWRLLNTLHEIFPLVVRLFCYYDFNQIIGFPYLCRYPPRHWSLNVIGDHLPQWIQENYHADDKNLVYECAKVDLAYNGLFFAPQCEPISSSINPEKNISGFLMRKIFLRPSIALFELNYNLFQARIEFLKQDPEYWLDNDFPELQKEKLYYFTLYRNQSNNLQWQEITEVEFRFLQLFKKGETIENACSWLERQSENYYEHAIKNMHLWFQEWTALGWLTFENPQTLQRHE